MYNVKFTMYNQGVGGKVFDIRERSFNLAFKSKNSILGI